MASERHFARPNLKSYLLEPAFPLEQVNSLVPLLQAPRWLLQHALQSLLHALLLNCQLLLVWPMLQVRLAWAVEAAIVDFPTLLSAVLNLTKYASGFLPGGFSSGYCMVFHVNHFCY